MIFGNFTVEIAIKLPKIETAKTLRFSKHPDFFEFGQFLMAEGHDWGLFCRLQFSTQT